MVRSSKDRRTRRNSIVALVLLWLEITRKKGRSLWVHPILQRRESSGKLWALKRVHNNNLRYIFMRRRIPPTDTRIAVRGRTSSQGVFPDDARNIRQVVELDPKLDNKSYHEHEETHWSC